MEHEEQPNRQVENLPKPLIVAPAGSKASFLSALAAGADAVYCGFKSFSARMEAENFSIQELASLSELAKQHGVKIYIALNSLLKNDEFHQASRLIEQLNYHVQPDAIIIQDFAFIEIAKQVGFKGDIHLSTLSCVTLPGSLQMIKDRFGVNRIVLPRELSIDEIKQMASACPDGMSLEVFVHGALCYGVSGRCYWSSFLGGKSGLRGRCVQPCRRLYNYHDNKQRYFSCQDLKLETLVRLLSAVPQVAAWKIEGRKKGPHYVYYTVSAYKLLRDHPNDTSMKKNAIELLNQALGRTGTSFRFLPQKNQLPIDLNAQTGSGLFIGKLLGPKNQSYVSPKIELIPQDSLRIGYEDEKIHTVIRVNRSVPKGGKYYLESIADKNRMKDRFVPVFLIDRREKALDKMIHQLEQQLTHKSIQLDHTSRPKLHLPAPLKQLSKSIETYVDRSDSISSPREILSKWLTVKTIKTLHRKHHKFCWWWLPPVIWPEQEKEVKQLLHQVIDAQATHFVLNAPWQLGLFPQKKNLFQLWAGPFCNVTNSLAISVYRSLGFEGVILSPELASDMYLELPKQSPIPLGMVIFGNYPMCISRIKPAHIKEEDWFESPKEERAFTLYHDGNYFVYPNWKLDLREKKTDLVKAGYHLLIHLDEGYIPNVPMKKREGLWNWNLELH
ncbi:MAG: U32 family peptidase [Desulfobacterales bacterium]|nr:U32 family peptidase [Desulfobacterales bacterium]